MCQLVKCRGERQLEGIIAAGHVASTRVVSRRSMLPKSSDALGLEGSSARPLPAGSVSAKRGDRNARPGRQPAFQPHPVRYLSGHRALGRAVAA